MAAQDRKENQMVSVTTSTVSEIISSQLEQITMKFSPKKTDNNDEEQQT